MKLYKIGKVISQGKHYLIFESNNTGLIIHVNFPEQFSKEIKSKIFIYEYQSEYLKSIFGFRTFNERIIFEDLLSISGIGPKTAMNLLKLGHKKLVEAIINQNIDLITSVRTIGKITAKQIIVELRDKYIKINSLNINKIAPGQISPTLKTLGFSEKQIQYAIDHIKPNNSLEKMIEEAIILISHEYKS